MGRAHRDLREAPGLSGIGRDAHVHQGQNWCPLSKIAAPFRLRQPLATFVALQRSTEGCPQPSYSLEVDYAVVFGKHLYLGREAYQRCGHGHHCRSADRAQRRYCARLSGTMRRAFAPSL
jgi:hypothetical protein